VRFTLSEEPLFIIEQKERAMSRIRDFIDSIANKSDEWNRAVEQVQDGIDTLKNIQTSLETDLAIDFDPEDLASAIEMAQSMEGEDVETLDYANVSDV
jgi:hypothetical protein